ncbi:hypothetical protein [Streptomyces capoamus]|nr:hypothetical protein [Streptomyces capoamus]
MDSFATQMQLLKGETDRLWAGLETLPPARRLQTIADGELRQVLEEATGKALDAPMAGPGTRPGGFADRKRGRLVARDGARSAGRRQTAAMNAPTKFCVVTRNSGGWAVTGEADLTTLLEKATGQCPPRRLPGRGQVHGHRALEFDL